MEEAPKSNLICVPSHPSCTLPSNNVVPVVAGQIILGTPKMENGFEGEKYKHLKIVLTVRAVPSKTDLMYTHHVMLIAP